MPLMLNTKKSKQVPMFSLQLENLSVIKILAQKLNKEFLLLPQFLRKKYLFEEQCYPSLSLVTEI